MKNFEYGTSEYWSNEVSKTGMKLSLLCKGLLTEAAEIVGNKELYDSAEISHYRYLREMCRTVVDAEDEYDRHLSMRKDAQERERAQQDTEPNEEPNGEEDS